MNRWGWNGPWDPAKFLLVAYIGAFVTLVLAIILNILD